MSFPLGVMFSAAPDIARALKEVSDLGVSHGQMAVGGELSLHNVSDSWRTAIESSGVRIHALFGVYTGESYADIATVQRTVGFIPRETRAAREARTLEIVELAAALGVPGIATHIGFVPENRNHDDYIAVRDLVRRIGNAAAKHRLTFALETGQESADALLNFLNDVALDNVGVNFDPANMILYGSGDPIDALATLGKHVLTVHAKDGVVPNDQGQLGVEVPLGTGSVDFPAFLATLQRIGYRGPLFIERECADQARRLEDIRSAINYLSKLSS